MSRYLYDNNVLFHHPATSGLIDYKEELLWTNASYVDINEEGIVQGSGIYNNHATTAATMYHACDGDYDTATGINSFVCAFWASGVDEFDWFEFGWGNTSNTMYDGVRIHLYANGYVHLRYYCDGTTLDSFSIIGPSYDTDEYIFFVARVEFDGTNASGSVSINGQDWIDFGEVLESKTPGGINQRVIAKWSNRHDSESAMRTCDEMIFWRDVSKFTAQELINLYNLGELYNKGMDQYNEQYGPPYDIENNIDLYVQGPKSLNASGILYTYGCEFIEISGTLFIHGYSPYPLFSISLFLRSFELLSDEITLNIQGHEPQNSGIQFTIYETHNFTSENISLYINGPNTISKEITLISYQEFSTFIDNTTLYANGHQIYSDTIPLVNQAHLSTLDEISLCIYDTHELISDEISLFINGHTIYDNESTLTIGASYASVDKSTTLYMLNSATCSEQITLIASGYDKIFDNIKLYIHGHDIIASGIDLFIQNPVQQSINIFVDVPDYIVDSSINLITYGKSISQELKYTNTEISLYIHEYEITHSGIKTTNLFACVPSGIPDIPYSGSWYGFVCAGGCDHSIIDCFIAGATISGPIPINVGLNCSCFVEGSGLFTSEGYIPYIDQERYLFVNVEVGLYANIPLIMNGLIWPTNEIIAYIHGYNNTANNTITLSIGRDAICTYDNFDMYINAESGIHTYGIDSYIHGYF